MFFYQFLQIDLVGKIAPACGSDAVHYSNRRAFNPAGMVEEGLWEMKRRKHVCPHFVGFEVRSGNFKCSTVRLTVVFEIPCVLGSTPPPQIYM